MLQLKRKSAFTLIELLVVVIIVAVLASVGIPLMAGQVARARLSEADAGLGTIRTGLRSFFAERQTYVGATFPLIGITLTALTNNDGDLDGRFFDDNDYTLTGGAIPLGVTTYCISVTGNGGAVPPNAPRSADVTALTHSMNQDGTIFVSANCS